MIATGEVNEEKVVVVRYVEVTQINSEGNAGLEISAKPCDTLAC